MHYAYMESLDTPADRLKAARLKKRIDTAVEAARQLGMRKTTYQNYEDGSRGFARHLIKLARFYGVRPQWLANKSGPMTSSEIEQKIESLPTADQEKAIEYIDMLAAKATARAARRT